MRRPALALAPWTLAAALLSAQASEDVTLRVRVVDAHGAPCPGIAVHVVHVHESGAESPVGWLDAYLVEARTDAEHGVATFERIDARLDADEGALHVARLAIPPLSAHEVRLPSDLRSSLELELVRPACGSVEIVFAPTTRGVVLLREAHSTAGEVSPMWNRAHPCRAELEGGVARFPLVGLGATFEYLAALEGTGPSIDGRFAGPLAAGEHVKHVAPGLDRHPRLVGRLLDEAGAPIAATELQFSVCTQGDGVTSRGIAVRTDAGGRFSMPLLQAVPPGGRRYVSIRAARNDAASRTRVGLGAAVVDLSGELAPGPHELGDIVLVVPGSSVYLATLDDAALARRYAACQLGGYDAPRVEHCLLEMVRRATPHWIAFLEQELERIRADAASQRSPDPRELTYLTALRRAEGKPDPLQVVVAGAVFATRLPATPVLDLALTNADVDGASFPLARGGSYRSGRFARCTLDATDAAGRRLATLPAPGSMGGGMFSRGTLSPGASIPIRLDLGDYVRFPGPGEYTVRVLYHDDEDIADARSVDGRILAHSAPFMVRLEAWRIRMSRGELEELSAALAALDTSQPVPLVMETWRPELEFVGPPSSPADTLFRAGPRAVPVLLDRLTQPDVDPVERGWIFGLLWNLTGLIHPTPGAIGPLCPVQAWPTVAGAAARANGANRGGSDKPWRSAQAELAERWSAIRPWIELEVPD